MRLSERAPRIALMGAMQEELSAVLALMQDASCETVAGFYFNQPRLRKYHMGTTALATMRHSAYG